MNRDKRPILFSKVKKFASHRKKELRFNLNPHLDREECLKEDLKLLKIINYDPPKPQESDVICETFMAEVSPEVLVLTEGTLESILHTINPIWNNSFQKKSSETRKGHNGFIILFYLVTILSHSTS